MPKIRITKRDLIAVCDRKLPSESFYSPGMSVADIKRLPAGYIVELQVPNAASVLNVLHGQHFSEWVTDNYEITDI